MVDSDPWGLPYKIVMRKLNIRRSIPGINLPGRLDSIIDTLFPAGWASQPTSKYKQTASTVFEEITNQELIVAAKNLPGGKAPGPDGVIYNEVLKIAVETSPSRFVRMYNKCIQQIYYPEDWKRANLVLIRKPGWPLDNPSSYRLICLLDTTRKLFEKILVERLRDHIAGSGRLTRNQYGFRPGRSTIYAMTRIQKIFTTANARATTNKHYVGILTMDVKNAFNSAPWETIKEALVRYETPGYLVDIIGQYLNKRSININQPDGTTRRRELTQGIPHRSVLGSDLWNLMYDDLLRIHFPKDVEIIAFAEDVVLVATASVTFLLEERLEEAFTDVVQWMDYRRGSNW